MQVTYKQIIDFHEAATRWVRANEERTKFHYALEKVLKQVSKHIDDFNDKRNEIYNDLAEVDEMSKNKVKPLLKGADGSLVFTAASANERNKKTLELIHTEVEVTGHISAHAPKLSSEYVMAFVPLVMEDGGEEGLPEKAVK